MFTLILCVLSLILGGYVGYRISKTNGGAKALAYDMLVQLRADPSEVTAAVDRKSDRTANREMVKSQKDLVKALSKMTDEEKAEFLLNAREAS